MATARFTATQAAVIKRIHADQPHLYQHEIGHIVRVNQGQVSRTLNGLRFASVPPATDEMLAKYIS